MSSASQRRTSSNYFHGTLRSARWDCQTLTKNHSDEIISEYRDNYSIYGNILKQVKSDAEISNIKIRKASNYLKKLSNDILKNSSGNPIEALDKLQSFYIQKLSKLNFEYDEQAVNFYLINELTGCNVFPNILEIKHD